MAITQNNSLLAPPVKERKKLPPLAAEPIQGKTYSLFGDSPTSDFYFEQIKLVADQFLEHQRLSELLPYLQQASRKKRYLKRLAENPNTNLLSRILQTCKSQLSIYTREVQGHLENLSVFQSWDRRLGTTEEQYHLYMLEIELVNRLYAKVFQDCEIKLAFFPYCLHDQNRDCMAKPEGLDTVCKGCSKQCWINHAHHLLKQHGVQPYIWMDANLRSLFQIQQKKDERLGVLGIACIPELVHGMRLCMRYQIPVVGIPLNANRCMRWMGDFHPTSVNLKILESLISPEESPV
jgi:hypothetical protein